MKTRTIIIALLFMFVTGSLFSAPILQVVIDVTANVLNISPDNIDQSDNFKFDLGASSLQFETIIDNLEDIYDVNIPDDEAEGLTTVGAVSKYLASK